MNRHPSSFAAVIAWFLVLILIIVLPLAVLTFDTGWVMFNTERMTEAVTKILLESRLAPAALQWYSEKRSEERVEQGLAVPTQNEPDVVQMLTYLDADKWQAIIDLVFKAEFVRPWARNALDGTYAWLDSDDEYPQVTLDMRAFKTYAGGESGEEAMLVALHNLPECNQAQIDDFLHRVELADATEKLFKRCDLPDPWTEAANKTFLSCANPKEVSALHELCTYPEPWEEDQAREFTECAQIAETGEALYNLCQFPNPWTQDQIDDYRESLQDVLIEMPDDLPITGQLVENEVVILQDTQPEAIKLTLRSLRLASRWSLLFPFLLLVAIFLVAGRTLKGSGLQMGIALVIGSILLILVTFTYRPLITNTLVSIPQKLLPESVLLAGTDALARLAGIILQPVLIEGIAILILGVLLIVVGSRPSIPKAEEASTSAETD
ncbi:MAG: MnhB domain-containing protein [Anaerolineae bacterium]|nr:MnhB domain-containing protein [Anaerolineae bacterium]